MTDKVSRWLELLDQLEKESATVRKHGHRKDLDETKVHKDETQRGI